MRLFLFVCLATCLCSVGLGSLPDKNGPHKVRRTTVRVGTFISGGPQIALLYYPRDFARLNESLPLISFAHGMYCGGIWNSYYYGHLMRRIASWGFVVIAPNSCPQLWCTENFTEDVARSIRDSKGLHAALLAADYSRTGVVGQSMGGNTAMKIATWDAVTELNIRAAVALEPGTMFDNNTLPYKIRIPVYV